MHHNRPARALFSLPSLAGLAVLALITLHATGAGASERGTSLGALMLSDGVQTHDALLLDADMQLEVQGLLASLTLTQRFSNQSSLWLEGRYRFPMPTDATVRGLSITLGERTIIGTVREKGDAEQTYLAAAAAGELASIVDRERPNLFTVRVANIAPKEQIVVSLDIMLPVQFADDTFRLTLPTTLTPRYSSSASASATSARIGGSGASADALDVLDTPILPDSRIRGPRLTLTARIDGLEDTRRIRSSTHPLQYQDDRVRLHSERMDRDLLLSWTLPHADSPTTWSYIDTQDGQRYVQLMMVPPEPPNVDAATPAQNRELVFVIDKSGSMAGQSMRAARAAVQLAVDALTPDDRFNVIAFDDRLHALFSSVRRATPRHLSAARRWLSELNADGGTEMQPALQMALHQPKNAPEPDDDTSRLRQIVFITDGSVSYENQMLESIDASLGSARLFTIGIGSAPNRWFLDKAAEFGRGTSLSITDIGEAQETMADLFDMLAHPALTDIEVAADIGDIDVHPFPIPDLYSGEPLMLIARIDDDVRSLRVSGSRGGEPFTATLELAEASSVASTIPSAGPGTETSLPPKSPDQEPIRRILPSSLAQHWARSRIESLEDDQRRQATSNTRAQPGSEPHRAEITRLALAHELVTRYTSFVAVEQERRRPVSASVYPMPVANLMPAGHAMTLVDLPAGAAGTDTLVAMAMMSGTLGGLCLILRRRRWKSLT